MMDIEIDSNERGTVDFALRIGKRRQAAHLARLASARLFSARTTRMRRMV
jgi:hypothetical protein